MTAEKVFMYYECPVCEFSLVLDKETVVGKVHCTLCAGDNGREVVMLGRAATEADTPEGHDARRALSAPAKAELGASMTQYISDHKKVAFIDKIAKPKFQARVFPWLITCFGETISYDKQERCHRFLEESLELVQALGIRKEEVYELVEYVYGRPDGEPQQEVGGVMVTLAALGIAFGIDIEEASEVELARIWTKVDQIRAKQATKPKNSPLPE